MTDSNEKFRQKVILVALGAVLGALATGLANFVLQSKKNHDDFKLEERKINAAIDLATRKFKSDLIIQSLDSPNFEQALQNLKFITEAGLIDDPDGKIKNAAVNNQPIIQPSPDISNIASSLEYRGFQALLSNNLNEAQTAFQLAYKNYPTFHNVDEINKLLKNKKDSVNWDREIYCPILKNYVWGMPNDLKQQMKTKAKC
jgi:hypothetical protein